jgi:hypothetical protein
MYCPFSFFSPNHIGPGSWARTEVKRLLSSQSGNSPADTLPSLVENPESRSDTLYPLSSCSRVPSGRLNLFPIVKFDRS